MRLRSLPPSAMPPGSDHCVAELFLTFRAWPRLAAPAPAVEASSLTASVKPEEPPVFAFVRLCRQDPAGNSLDTVSVYEKADAGESAGLHGQAVAAMASCSAGRRCDVSTARQAGQMAHVKGAWIGSRADRGMEMHAPRQGSAGAGNLGHPAGLRCVAWTPGVAGMVPGGAA